MEKNASTNDSNSIYNAAIRAHEAKMKFVLSLKYLAEFSNQDLMKQAYETEIENLITQGNEYAMIREEFVEEVMNNQKAIQAQAPVQPKTQTPVHVSRTAIQKPKASLFAARTNLRTTSLRTVPELFSGPAMPSTSFMKLLDAIQTHYSELRTEFTANKINEFLGFERPTKSLSSKISKLYQCGIIEKVRKGRDRGYWIVSDIALLKIDEIKRFLADKQNKITIKQI